MASKIKSSKCEFCNEEPPTEIYGRLERRDDGTLGFKAYSLCFLCARRQEKQRR